MQIERQNYRYVDRETKLRYLDKTEIKLRDKTKIGMQKKGE